MTFGGSTATVGRIALDFLMCSSRGPEESGLSPHEYAIHQMAISLPEKTALYYGLVRTVEGLFHQEVALAERGARVLHGCMAAMAANCWRTPDDDGTTRASHLAFAVAKLRKTYVLIHHETPGEDTMRHLQRELDNAFEVPTIPEHGMGELAQAVTWIADMHTRALIAGNLGQPVFAERFEWLMERQRSLGSRLERGVTPEDRVKLAGLMVETQTIWLMNIFLSRELAGEAGVPLRQALLPLVDPAVV